MLFKVNKLIFLKEMCPNHCCQSNCEILQNFRFLTNIWNEKRGKREGEKPIVHPQEGHYIPSGPPKFSYCDKNLVCYVYKCKKLLFKSTFG